MPGKKKSSMPSASISFTLPNEPAKKLYYNAKERCIAISRFCERAVIEAMEKAKFDDVPVGVTIEIPSKKKQK